jgi:hypothetical protein
MAAYWKQQLTTRAASPIATVADDLTRAWN